MWTVQREHQSQEQLRAGPAPPSDCYCLLREQNKPNNVREVNVEAIFTGCGKVREGEEGEEEGGEEEGEEEEEEGEGDTGRLQTCPVGLSAGEQTLLQVQVSFVLSQLWNNRNFFLAFNFSSTSTTAAKSWFILLTFNLY